MTLPPTVNWLDEMVTPSSKWQLMPPIITGRMPIVTPFSRPEQAVAVQPGGTTTTQAEKKAAPAQVGSIGDSLVGADPFAWWSTTRTKAPSPVAETLPQRPPVRLASPQGHACRQPNRVNRRRAVTLIVSGTATAGVLAVGGLSFARFLQSIETCFQEAVATPRRRHARLMPFISWPREGASRDSPAVVHPEYQRGCQERHQAGLKVLMLQTLDVDLTRYCQYIQGATPRSRHPPPRR